ncbi:preprotein translocase subunit YajC [soil metagenome]
MSLLDLLISPAAAQAAGAPAGQPSLISSLALPALFFVVVFFLMIRPQMKKAKEHRELIAKLAKGDEVITNGGIAGRVSDMGENFITLEVAEGVRVKLQRNAIVAVLPRDTLKSA